MKTINNYNEITKENYLLFKCIRGSQSHGLATPTSDIDTYGIYCCPKEWLYGTGSAYVPMFADEKNDNVINEIGKFIKELEKSNPNALEALFIKSSLVEYRSPILDPLWAIKDQLITKQCFDSFAGYAVSQLKKMAGLKKAMNTNPEEVKERKTLLRFSWVPRNNGDGVWDLDKWLREANLKQEHCGIARCANGDNLYQLYYDWAADTELSWEDCVRISKELRDDPELGITREEFDSRRERGFIEYRGILDPNNPSTQPRLSSISKEPSKHPLCAFQFNDDAYSCHCKKYKEYWEWVEHRNPERFNMNVGYNFDAKNACEMIRLMTTAKEIAQGQGFKLDREEAGDREFLLSIKRHEISYDELKTYAESLEAEMKDAFNKSTLPDAPDIDLLEDILVDIRNNFYDGLGKL